MKSDFILSKLLPIMDGPIIDFMTTPEETDHEYNKTFPLLLIIAITVCPTILTIPLKYLMI